METGKWFTKMENSMRENGRMGKNMGEAFIGQVRMNWPGSGWKASSKKNYSDFILFWFFLLWLNFIKPLSQASKLIPYLVQTIMHKKYLRFRFKSKAYMTLYTIHLINILKLFWPLQWKILKALLSPMSLSIPCTITQPAKTSNGISTSTKPPDSIWTHFSKSSKENTQNKKKDKKIKNTSPKEASTWTTTSKLPNQSLHLVTLFSYFSWTLP
jgi:hypothetical protein